MQAQDLTPNPMATTETNTPPGSAQQFCAAATDTAPAPTQAPQPDADAELLDLADDLAAKVRQCEATALGWQIMAAGFLRDCRDQLSRSDWKKILRSRRLGAPRTVQTLVRVAGQKVFRDTNRIA